MSRKQHARSGIADALAHLTPGPNQAVAGLDVPAPAELPGDAETALHQAWIDGHNSAVEAMQEQYDADVQHEPAPPAAPPPAAPPPAAPPPEPLWEVTCPGEPLPRATVPAPSEEMAVERYRQRFLVRRPRIVATRLP